MKTLMLPIACILALAAARPAQADPQLGVPVDCAIGRDCFVQNYVDQDPGGGHRDFTCGPLSYDGHAGTDFRARDYVAMNRGVPVVAAAAGTVLRVRDGMEDVNIRQIGVEALGGRDGGNAVVIDHGDGWETQYNHMRRGSVAVAPGQQVAAGQQLGLIGLSGRTEFPHLDFVVRKDGKTIDPFVGPVPFAACTDARRPLWRKDVLARLSYRASGLLNAGFSLEAPDVERVRRGEQRIETMPHDPDGVVFWTNIFGGRRDDLVVMTIIAPDRKVLSRAEVRLDRNLGELLLATDARRPPGGWTGGCYRGEVELRRGRDIVVKENRCLTRPG